MSIWRSYPKNLKVLLIAMLINSTGMAFLWPLHTIYITQGMGKTLSEAGFVLMPHSGAEIVGSFLGGYLYDRIRGSEPFSLRFYHLPVVFLLFPSAWRGPCIF